MPAEPSHGDRRVDEARFPQGGDAVEGREGALGGGRRDTEGSEGLFDFLPVEKELAEEELVVIAKSAQFPHLLQDARETGKARGGEDAEIQ